MDGKTRGYNTDVIGFEKSLLPLLQPQHTQALVLGSGGASKAVLFVLAKLGVTVAVVSRQPAPGNLAYTDVTPELIAKYTVIINTTPLGMYPNVGVCPPIPYEALGSRHLLYDLIYNPPITKFLAMGMAQGAQIKNGQEMLELQAEASWEIWNS
jgi:shikimate dehydrogenase